MSFRKKSLSALKWSFLDKLFKRGIKFILALFLARLLLPEDYGLLAMATVFVAMGNIFSDFGLGQAIIQATEVSKKQYSTVFFINVITGLVLTAIIYVASPYIADFYNDERLTSIIRVISISYVINGVNHIHGMRFYRNLDIKSVTTVSVYSDVASGIFGILLAYSGFGVWSLVYQRLSRGVIYTILLWVKAKWIPMAYFNFKEVKELFSYGVSLLGVGLVQELSGYVDTIFLGKFMTPEFLGVFDRGKTFPTFLRNTFVYPFTRPLFPIFSRIKDDKELLKKSAFEVLDNLMPVLFLGYGLLAVFSEEIIVFLITDKWLASAIYLRVFAFALVFSSLYSVSSSLYKALGKKELLLYLIAAEKTIQIAALLCGIFIHINIYIYGLFGLSVVIAAVRMYYNTKLIGAGWWSYYFKHLLFIGVVIGLYLLKIYLVDFELFGSLIVFGLFSLIYSLVYWRFVIDKMAIVIDFIKEKLHR